MLTTSILITIIMVITIIRFPGNVAATSDAEYAALRAT